MSKKDFINDILKVAEREMIKLNHPCKTAYDYFAAMCAYNRALAMEKKYNLLSDKVKQDYRIYRKIMYKYFFIYIFSRYTKIKDRILYLMVITKLLRPIYKLFYKNHL